MTGGCLLCEMEQAAPSAVVFRDELWAAEVAPGYEVPGWFFLRVRRHAERLTGLDDAELSALGHRARDLVAAVTEATAAPATYLLHFGENYRHFHALVAARGADIPAGQRGGNILGLRPGHVDVAAAIALVPSVRAAYQRTALGTLHRIESADRPGLSYGVDVPAKSLEQHERGIHVVCSGPPDGEDAYHTAPEHARSTGVPGVKPKDRVRPRPCPSYS
jgi:diadenosine tetraphosphate (Ap4A) HIT family hydrolase